MMDDIVTVSLMDLILLYINSFKPSVLKLANSIAPDVTPQNAASHLGLFCLLREISSKMQ